MQLQAKVSQRRLLPLTKAALCIAGKRRGRIQRLIRRVKIDKIAFSRVQFSEVPQPNIHMAQRHMASSQHLWLANGRVGIAAHRHIEFAAAVHPPQAIEAGLVEIDEASRYFNTVIEMMLPADVVVEVFAVPRRVLAQFDDEGFGIALDDLVSLN